MKKAYLGVRQEGCLKALSNHGAWYPGCGWIWGTRSETVSILDSLEKKGLVEVEPKGRHKRYCMTDKGRRWLADRASRRRA